MGMFIWKSEYEVGIKEMDDQHKKWLEILNNFYDNVAKDSAKENLKTLLEEAIDYTKYHFEEEEKLLKEMNYPHLPEQQDLHSVMIKQLEQFRTDFLMGKLVVSLGVTHELRSWLRDHILFEDKKYGEYYKQM